MTERSRRARASALREDVFLAAVCHELRGPLATLLLWHHVLASSASDARLRQRALDAIQESALAQTRLIGDLHDLARALRGSLVIEQRPVDFGAIVASALATAVESARDRGIAISARGSLSRMGVRGDAARLRQTLAHLLANAVASSEPDGTITVAIARTTKTVSIEIGYAGHGIAPAQLARIFMPFEHEDYSTRPAYGLGLAKHLVELHDGTLRAASAGPDKVAFTLSLPRLRRVRRR